MKAKRYNHAMCRYLMGHKHMGFIIKKLKKKKNLKSETAKTISRLVVDKTQNFCIISPPKENQTAHTHTHSQNGSMKNL